MKYAFEMVSRGMIYISTFARNDSGVQILLDLDKDTHRQQGDLISLLLLFQRKWPKIRVSLVENEEICNLL
jgi:hypothetical protein